MQGTRHELFDASHPVFGQAITIFEKQWAEAIERVVRNSKELKNTLELSAYFEYIGPNSFAGSHWEHDPKELYLIDVWTDKKGILRPADYLKWFGHLNVPRIIYQGDFTADFVQDVRDGKYPVYEGIIAKGTTKRWMRKTKTLEYLDHLKKSFQEDWERYWE